MMIFIKLPLCNYNCD